MQNFCACDLQVDHDRGEGCLDQLTGVVDGVAINDDQLHGSGQLKDPLNLGLDLGQVRSPATILLEDLPVGGIVEDRCLAEGEVDSHVGDDDPSLEFVLEELKHSLLQHVGHLVPLEAGPDHHHGSHDRHDIKGAQGLALLPQQPLLLLDDGRRGDPDPARALLASRRVGDRGGRRGSVVTLSDSEQENIISREQFLFI